MPPDYRLVRSVRGLPSTMEAFELPRHDDGVAPELWQRHAAGGIARDGSPSGNEYAVVGERGVILLRPWWYDNAGALRWRKLGDREGVARVLGLMTHTALRVLERKPEVVVAVADLDALTRLCGRPHGDRGDLAGAAVPAVRARAGAVARAARAGGGGDGERGRAPDGRRLIVEAPGDAATATVYADWLEEIGRLDEARAAARGRRLSPWSTHQQPVDRLEQREPAIRHACGLLADQLHGELAEPGAGEAALEIPARAAVSAGIATPLTGIPQSPFWRNSTRA